MKKTGLVFRYMPTLVAALLACQVVGAYAGEFVDPTRPAGLQSSTIAPKASYTLQSILFSGNRKVATINGKSYITGDKTPLGKILLIEKDRVVIQGKHRRVLKLQSELYKIKR
jgi:hypothetical protein